MFTIAVGMILAASSWTGTTLAADALLVEFSSPHCGPCQAMKPTLAQLERSGVPIRHVDVVSEPHLATRYGIRKTPTFIVMVGGKEITRLTGMQSVGQLQAALAIDPTGPLVDTRATTNISRNGAADIPAPRTRLAPRNDRAPSSGFAPLRQAGLMKTEPTALAAGAERTVDLRTGPEASAFGSQEMTFLSAPRQASPRRASPRSEPMPSMSLADAVERAQAATVRLRVHDGHGFGAGTGTIIDTHGEEALVLTCGHLFRETKGEGKIEVDLFIGGQTRTVLGEVIDYDADTRDIALVVIRPGFQVQAIQVDVQTDRVQTGEPAFSFGCDRGDDPSRRDTRITGVNKYNQHLGVSNLEIQGAPIDGRSGGGLFNSVGRLIGVCNAADYKNDIGIYAGPGNVQWQLDRVGLASLYETAGQSSISPAISPAASPAAKPATDRIAAVTPAASPPPSLAGLSRDQEVIVIVRDRNNPDSTSRVLTLHEPSSDLMQMIERSIKR